MGAIDFFTLRSLEVFIEILEPRPLLEGSGCIISKVINPIYLHTPNTLHPKP